MGISSKMIKCLFFTFLLFPTFEKSLVYAYQLGEFNEEYRKYKKAKKAEENEETDIAKPLKEKVWNLLQALTLENGLFSHLELTSSFLLTSSKKEIKYQSCCWYTLGLLDIFCSLHCLDFYIPSGGIKLVISNVKISKDDFTFWIKVDEYNEEYKFQGLFAFTARTGGNNQIKKFAEQLQDKKGKTIYSFLQYGVEERESF